MLEINQKHFTKAKGPFIHKARSKTEHKLSTICQLKCCKVNVSANYSSCFHLVLQIYTRMVYKFKNSSQYLVFEITVFQIKNALEFPFS